MSAPAVAPGMVALRFLNGRLLYFEWWFPRPQLRARVAALSCSTLVRALRVGVVDLQHNPPELVALLEAELRRRLKDGEWIPTLTPEERERWTRV